MGDALRRGMVLTLSVWDDPFSNMLWLDAKTDDPRKDSSLPGISRGPCPFAKFNKSYREDHKASFVEYTNIRYGEIGSTYSTSNMVGVPAPEPTTGKCCLAAADSDDSCNSCYPRGRVGQGSWCDWSESNCGDCAGQTGAWCPYSTSGMGSDFAGIGAYQTKASEPSSLFKEHEFRSMLLGTAAVITLGVVSMVLAAAFRIRHHRANLAVSSRHNCETTCDSDPARPAGGGDLVDAAAVAHERPSACVPSQYTSLLPEGCRREACVP